MTADKKDDRQGGTADVLAPPPFIFLGAIAVGWGIHHLHPLTLPAALGVAGQLAIGCGFILILWSLLAFRRSGTAPSPYRPTTALVDSGPYRLSRNPIYLGFCLVHLGIGLCLGNAWMIVMLPPALLAVRHGVIAREERYLSARFGDEYRRYCARVRRWL